MQGASRFSPPTGWDRKLDDVEWVFEYRRPGLANNFFLHCSLQKETQRLFVQATEKIPASRAAVAAGEPAPAKVCGSMHDGMLGRSVTPCRMVAPSHARVQHAPVPIPQDVVREGNVQNLGLQLTNYITDLAKARKSLDWSSVFSNESR